VLPRPDNLTSYRQRPARLLDTLWVYHHNGAVKLSHLPVKPCLFVRPSRRELKALPEEVRGRIGHALYQAQCGQEPVSAKALKGFGGRGVLEVVEDFDGDTYRAVYTVRFAGSIYVLHAFQKKSKKGIATPKQTIELIKSRLRDAEEDYRARKEGERKL
jgi:phage-related protein